MTNAGNRHRTSPGSQAACKQRDSCNADMATCYCCAFPTGHHAVMAEAGALWRPSSS